MPKSDLILIGSTPADSEIRASLKIDAAKPVDFIRWNLELDTERGTFVLAINFGEGQPNTRGFKGGGETRRLEGRFSVSRNRDHLVYKFEGEGLGSAFSLIKVGENVFHLIRRSGDLMTGTGGWSYSLARRDRIVERPNTLTSISKGMLDDRGGTPIVFVGRTPCADLNRSDLESSANCLKLKWKLTLFRDLGRTYGRYKLESTVSRLKPIEGRWSLVNGTHASPRALLIELDGDQRARTISFMVGDENVIFLLDRQGTPAVGNEDFAFTLNRMPATE